MLPCLSFGTYFCASVLAFGPVFCLVAFGLVTFGFLALGLLAFDVVVLFFALVFGLTSAVVEGFFGMTHYSVFRCCSSIFYLL